MAESMPWRSHPAPRVTPEPPPVEGARWVPLTRGRFALVDATDFDDVMRFTWMADGGYAARGVGDRLLRMHVYLAGGVGIEVDHVDGNGLNNRRSNLRRATRQQNTWNTRIRSDNTSGFKGVTWSKKRRHWVASISANGRYMYLGDYDDVIEAACAYNEAARRHFGDFARFNRMDYR